MIMASENDYTTNDLRKKEKSELSVDKTDLTMILSFLLIDFSKLL